ncbi:PH domain-containing protein [Arachnia propionica]|uniref:PH domain-containing protein n=1 Tax=Arachnia propionica TaxID=1750 RepID=A0A3P1WSU9_9ACTN|nr:PH domain-containing protein [Arachnia propionica]RRD49689.1 PH domain-containing protein [Arachnia propionica]
MALKHDLLARDEQVVLHLRTHLKALFWPLMALFASAAVFGVLLAWLPADWRPWSTYGLIALFLIVVIAMVIVPFLRWRTSTYTVTNRRIITRHGILNKTGHDLPLRSINNVTYERSVTDRMLGCGTLVLETAADEPLSLPDVPGVERVNTIIADLLFDGQPDPE